MRSTSHHLPSRRIAWLLISCMAAGLVACVGMPAETADAVLLRANTAMGGTGLRSISFAGSGTGSTFGQAYSRAWRGPKSRIRVFRGSRIIKMRHFVKTQPVPVLSRLAAAQSR